MVMTNRVFPPYEYHEYPKWVTIEDKEPVLVASAIEEEALYKKNEEDLSPEELDDKISLEELPDDKNELMKLAVSLGIPAKRVWSTNKLKAEILKLKEDENEEEA